MPVGLEEVYHMSPWYYNEVKSSINLDVRANSTGIPDKNVELPGRRYTGV